MTEKPVRYVARTTADLTQQQIDRLKQIFPECVAEGKVDFDILRATLGDADAIAAELSDPSLALHLAGSFLAIYRRARFGVPDACLAQLRQVGLGHPSLAGSGRTLTPTRLPGRSPGACCASTGAWPTWWPCVPIGTGPRPPGSAPA